MLNKRVEIQMNRATADQLYSDNVVCLADAIFLLKRKSHQYELQIEQLCYFITKCRFPADIKHAEQEIILLLKKINYCEHRIMKLEHLQVQARGR